MIWGKNTNVSKQIQIADLAGVLQTLQLILVCRALWSFPLYFLSLTHMHTHKHLYPNTHTHTFIPKHTHTHTHTHLYPNTSALSHSNPWPFTPDLAIHVGDAAVAFSGAIELSDLLDPEALGEGLPNAGPQAVAHGQTHTVGRLWRTHRLGEQVTADLADVLHHLGTDVLTGRPRSVKGTGLVSIYLYYVLLASFFIFYFILVCSFTMHFLPF